MYLLLVYSALHHPLILVRFDYKKFYDRICPQLHGDKVC